ncbi:MAG: septal ring lytic transglycosylase RlpA family protein [Pseudomonadales bacterium]|nr:septal ring lytic transglycosylase RlpA family protein [Pseudomonadales bacterium]
MLPPFCKCFLLSSGLLLAACNYQVKPQTAPVEDVSESDAFQLSRYDVAADFSPEKQLQPNQIKDADPQPEARSRGGNYSPYTVFGKTYEVLSDENALLYKEQGGASWYGLKFHGHKTSNGEIYDIYGMTAAHKTLPIPSYVRVTNLQNKRSCIVRVNDRGPFHDGRIIDLSYAAATKLGYKDQGTAWVSVETIDAIAWQAQRKFEQELAIAAKKQQLKKAAAVEKNIAEKEKTIYLQLGAYSRVDIAKAKYQTLYAKYSHPVFLESGIDQYHRLKIGPIAEQQLAQIQADLAEEGYPAPVRLKTR